jgi:hypothetical protein
MAERRSGCTVQRNLTEADLGSVREQAWTRRDLIGNGMTLVVRIAFPDSWQRLLGALHEDTSEVYAHMLRSEYTKCGNRKATPAWAQRLMEPIRVVGHNDGARACCHFGIFPSADCHHLLYQRASDIDLDQLADPWYSAIQTAAKGRRRKLAKERLIGSCEATWFRETVLPRQPRHGRHAWLRASQGGTSLVHVTKPLISPRAHS